MDRSKSRGRESANARRAVAPRCDSDHDDDDEGGPVRSWKVGKHVEAGLFPLVRYLKCRIGHRRRSEEPSASST